MRITKHRSSFLLAFFLMSAVQGGSKVFAESPVRTAISGKKVERIDAHFDAREFAGRRRSKFDSKMDVARLDEVLRLFDNVEPSDDKSGDLEEIVRLTLRCDDGTTSVVVVKWSGGKLPMNATVNGMLYTRSLRNWEQNDDAGAVYLKLKEISK